MENKNIQDKIMDILDKKGIEFDCISLDNATGIIFEIEKNEFEVIKPFYGKCYIICRSKNTRIQQNISFRTLKELLEIYFKQ